MATRKKSVTAATLNYSVKTAAILTELSETTIRDMIARGQIHAIKIGNKSVRIPRAELQRLGVQIDAEQAA